jgi:drug/metabolite transporter (DMT)-like permease
MLLGVATGIAGSALYALSVIVYRTQSNVIRPIAISAIKMWVSFLFMTLIIILLARTSIFYISFQSVFFLAISALLAAVCGDTFYLLSHERIGVSYAFPIAVSHPIFTYILTIIFLQEPLLLGRLSGTCIAVIGVIMISLARERLENETSRLEFIGIFLALITAFSYAAGAICLQIGVNDVDPIDATFIRIMIGSAAFVPLVLLVKQRGMPMPSRNVIKLVAIAGVFGMGLSSLLYVTSIKLVGAAITSLVCSTSSMFAVPISIFYLKESLSKFGAIGIIAIIVGIILVISGV